MKKPALFLFGLFIVLTISYLEGNAYAAQIEQKVFAGGEESLFVVQVNNSVLEIFEISPEGEIKSKIYSSGNKDNIPICINKDLILFASNKKKGISLYDTKQKKFQKIPNTKNCDPGGFVKNKDWIIYTRIIDEPNGKYQIEFYDYLKKQVVKILDGYRPNCSVFDNIVYFIEPGKLIEYDGTVKDIRTLYSYDISKDLVSEIVSKGLGEYYLDVMEIVGLSKDFFCYQVYDQHEDRYYYYKDKEYPFYSGGKGHLLNGVMGESKEQFNLIFSKDGLAAFFERNWNELSYLVIVDLKNKKRIETQYYGAWPLIKGNIVYFISDPELVMTKQPELQQFKNFAIYSYGYHSKKLRKIKQFEGHVEFIKD